jgi:hypothetical protein
MNARNCLVRTAVVAAISGFVAADSLSDETIVSQTLNQETFNYWRDFIHPSQAESAWERPGWQTSLWAGVTLAQEKKMPLVVWFMTGHPCGMT